MKILGIILFIIWIIGSVLLIAVGSYYDTETVINNLDFLQTVFMVLVIAAGAITWFSICYLSLWLIMNN